MNLDCFAEQRSASPHEVLLATKFARPGLTALNFQTTVPQPIPGSWQLAGAVGPGIIAVIVGVSLPLRLVEL